MDHITRAKGCYRKCLAGYPKAACKADKRYLSTTFIPCLFTLHIRSPLQHFVANYLKVKM